MEKSIQSVKRVSRREGRLRRMAELAEELGKRRPDLKRIEALMQQEGLPFSKDVVVCLERVLAAMAKI